MKLQRAGFTEGTLIFCHYLRSLIEPENQYLLDSVENTFINWLFTTSGWYDNTIPGSYFNFIAKDIVLHSTYKEFLSKYTTALKFSDHVILPIHEPYLAKFLHRLPAFRQELSCATDNDLEDYWHNSFKIYPFLENKKVLVISSFDELIYSQYSSGNIYKIFSNFPKLEKLICINFPYCFFNNGPDNNILTTINKIISGIEYIDFDIALVGCGASAVIIVDEICAMGKDAISMGSGIAGMFGIQPGKTQEKYWITTIPEKYIPKNFHLIEDGRYWIGEKQ